MRLSHPSAPFSGVPAEDVFFAANDHYVQMGVGYIVLSFQEDAIPERPLQLYLDIKSQPSARNLLLGALLGRSEQMRAAFPGVRGRVYTEIAPTQFDMLNFYTQNGFSTEDAREEYLIQLPSGPSQPPMGCEFASVPLETVQDQYAFLQRLNKYRLSPIMHDYLTIQMQQAYFLALGFYRAGHPIAEMMITGASADTAALVMVYVQRDMRKRGVARALLAAGSDLLRQRGVTQALAHARTGSAAQMGLVRMMSGSRRKIITVLPSLPFG